MNLTKPTSPANTKTFLWIATIILAIVAFVIIRNEWKKRKLKAEVDNPETDIVKDAPEGGNDQEVVIEQTA